MTTKPFPPSGLVLSTSKSLQSYEELVECDVEDFLEYIDELAEKAVLIKHKEEPRRGIIIRPCDSSRYFPGGKRKAKRNIRKRFGKNYSVRGTFITLTYDHSAFARWEAWERLQADLKRFKNNVKMRYHRVGRRSPMYISVIEEQRKTGYPHVHIFYPKLRWLLPKEDVQKLWSVGWTRIEYAKSVNIGGYVCKYITKMNGWSEEALAFIWKNKLRMYSYSRCYALPIEEKRPSEWHYYFSTKRAKIRNNPFLIIQALPEIENLEEYLEAG